VGGIFVLRSDLMPEADQILLQTVARIVLSTSRGSLSQHLRRGSERIPIAPALLARPTTIDDTRPFPVPELQHPNQYGGFDAAHNDYVIDLTPEQATPAPWSNVIANEQFGFLITERGGGYTWAGNSRENRLTPWSNDPVCDTPGEVMYLRDQTTGSVWSATPAPIGNGHVRVRHGFGYTSFSQSRGAIQSELRLSVAGADPVKLFRLRLQNEGNEPRQLSATLYLEWVLGVFRDGMAATIITQVDAEAQALLAQNPYHPEFGDQIAFMACSEPAITISADRSSFIGRNGDLARPLALQQSGLDGRVGAGLDPCGAIQVTLTLAAGEVREVVFLLGQAGSITAARELIARYRTAEAAAQAEQDAISSWQRMLGQIQVTTPQPELDVLLNGWLLYQTLVCRIWGRSAFYQSGGAYGFRDQLQDVMALTHAAPDITRTQIVRAAARQFAEGDVQHWWHPPTGRGIRSTCSDDYLWLPFVTNHYLTSTGDS
jgi:cyclic beta-1,2-glucan synthetase